MLMDTASLPLLAARRLTLVATAMLLLACSAPGPRGGPDAPNPSAPVVAPQPPPVPAWRDDPPLAVSSGRAEWTDPSRDRTIDVQWSAPSGVAPRALLVVLPGLAQGSYAPPALIEALAGAGFAVVVLGHPGNDASVWQGPDARRADFTQAARRVYAANEAAERGADVRFVLDALERQPPAWLPPGESRGIGAIGIGLGAQTLQLLLGEPMARGQTPVSETRIKAAALLGPYVGFEGPAMHQRYGAIVTPLLVAYGLTESDPFGLGMTSQQRRAMVSELRNARVTEVRLPTSSLVGTLVPGSTAAASGMPDTAPAAGSGPASRGDSSTRSRTPGGAPSGSGVPQGSLLARRPGPETANTARPAGVSAGDRAARVALLLSVQAFFEAQLLGSADARDWLEGPHPGPVQWTTYPVPRARQ